MCDSDGGQEDVQDEGCSFVGTDGWLYARTGINVGKELKESDRVPYRSPHPVSRTREIELVGSNWRPPNSVARRSCTLSNKLQRSA